MFNPLASHKTRIAIARPPPENCVAENRSRTVAFAQYRV
jgi:hypothetical protein